MWIIRTYSQGDAELRVVGDPDLRPVQRQESYSGLYEHIKGEVVGGREQT